MRATPPANDFRPWDTVSAARRLALEMPSTMPDEAARASIEQSVPTLASPFPGHGFHQALLEKCRSRNPLPAAVIYPIDGPALAAAVEAAEERLIVPILIGPAATIERAASAAGLDVSPWEIVDAPNEGVAAALGAQLAHQGRVQMLMKGSLHTDILLHAVLSHASGLRSSAWVSHVFLFDVPAYPKPLLLSDAVIAITPTLEQKAMICRNAIEVAHTIGIDLPKLAILSATEDVEPTIPSTIDAAALCKMADRGQITGAMVDGPLAMDNAINPVAAAAKEIISPVGGDADILIVPNLEAGNILYKSLTYFADAQAAGVVIGASVPIILASRADSVQTRIASAALASVLAAKMT